MRGEQKQPSVITGQHTLLYLATREVAIWPRKNRSCLHPFLAGGMLSFRDVLPWPFPSALKISKNDLSSPDKPFQIF